MEKKFDIVGIVAGSAGAAIAIAAMQLLSTSTAFPLVLVPFATSIVLVMGSPAAAPAQPRPLIGGHLAASLVGLLVVKLLGPSVASAALSVGLAVALMHATRTFHPPAAIDPLVIVTNNLSWGFLLAPVAVGAVLLAAFAFVWHNLVRRGSWPTSWW